MAIAFVNSATAQLNAAGTSLACNVPSGVANGNVLITLVENNIVSATVTPPGGWTHLAGFANSGSSNSLDAYYRVAASEPASYTWSFTSAKANIACLAYSGVAASPIDASSAGGSSSPNAATPTVTATGPADWIISVFSDRDSSAGSTWSTPAGTTSRVAMLNTGTSQGSLAVFDIGPVSAGSYFYSSTSTTTNSGSLVAAIALLAAPSGFVPAETTQLGGFF